MTYASVYIETEIDVDLSQFETEDLIAELDSRNGVLGSEMKMDLSRLYDALILAPYTVNVNFSKELDDFFRKHLGKGL